jgi:hypothetical protein
MQMRKTDTKCERILWFGPALSKKVRNSLLAVLAFSVLLTPTYAMAAEREGTVLFFSFDDLKKALSHPSLSSLSQLSPSFAWRDLHDQAYEESNKNRSLRIFRRKVVRKELRTISTD